MSRLPEIPPGSVLAPLFRQARVQAAATWFSLPGGQALYSAGTPAEQLFVLRTGRLGAFRREEGHEPQFLGVIRPGEPAGEMALVAGAVHSADMVALRDCEVLCVPRDVFFEACEEDASVMTALARLMIQRIRQTAGAGSVGEPSVFGFTASGETGALRPLVEAICQEVARLGYSATTVGVEAQGAPTEWFSNVERDHDFVLYVAESADVGWGQMVSRQVDRLFRIGRGDRKPPVSPPPIGSPLQAQHLVDLILLQPPRAAAPRGSQAWLDVVQPARLFHLRRGVTADVQRIARVLTGQSVGLVLSGGGARAYAHIGAIRALRERDIPIDFIAGVSMGAIIGAGLARGWSGEEMETRIREAFVDTSPIDDIALPLLAMSHGMKVAARLAHHFGEIEIADLWLPFFCISSNLTTGAYQIHRRGPVRHALRASSALPGVLPPATDGQNVLVDGAVLKNFPTDIMRATQMGPIVGVDVTTGRSITADDVARPSSIWRWIWSGQWRKGPPIVSLLIRAATVSSGRDHAAAREATDVLILPDMTGVEIRDWSAFDPAVAEGYRAACAALDKLTHPVQSLRRHTSLRDPQPVPAKS